MIGQKSFTISQKDFMAGMSTATYTNDGGYASAGSASGTIIPSTINLTAKPGILYPPGPVTDKTISDVTSLFISSTSDSNFNGYERVFVSDDAKYYSWSGSALTLKHTDATANRNYSFGKTDMVTYGFSNFTTSSGTGTGITRWQTSSDTFTDNFFAFSDTVAPHPALVFENNVYYGDGDLLLVQTAEASTPTTVLDLEDNAIITALGIDPGSGNMLIATSQAINMADLIKQTFKVLMYDGFSNKVISSYIVDDMITAFYPLGGIVYIGYGNKLGYWSGSGIQFLRTLNIALSQNELPYKAHFTNIDNTLYVVEERNILAYGEILPNKKVFYYILQNNAGDAGNYSLITNIGTKKLGLSFATAKFYTFDTANVSSVVSGGSVFWTNRYEFDRPVTFNNIVVEFLETLPANESIITVLMYDDRGNTAPTTLGTIVTGASNNPLVYELPYPDITTRSMQFRVTLGPPSSGSYGIRRMTVFYNPYD